MKVLLDHCMPRPFGKTLRGHSAKHTSDVGLEEVSNGELLQAAAEQGFGVVLTVDTNLADQQHIGELPVAVIIVFVMRNTEAALQPHIPEILALLSSRLQRRIYFVGQRPKRKRRG